MKNSKNPSTRHTRHTCHTVNTFCDIDVTNLVAINCIAEYIKQLTEKAQSGNTIQNETRFCKLGFTNWERLPKNFVNSSSQIGGTHPLCMWWSISLRHMIGTTDMSALIFSRLLGVRSELSPHADLFAVTC